MGRGTWTRRSIAVLGGVLVNGLVLGALVLIEEPPPQLGEHPVILLEIERPERRVPPRSAAASGRPATSMAPASTPLAVVGGMPDHGKPTQAEADAPAPPIDPQWRVDPKAVERWRLTEGVPEWNWGRYYRACKGLSSEHMTPDEKERCYSGWKDRPTTKRPSPDFVGPIDERHWAFHEPDRSRRSTAEEDKLRRRDLCRVVGQMRRANPSGPPLVRQGACP